MAITLPTKKTPPEPSPNTTVVTVYGPPGIGKSTFVSGARKCLMMACEPGLNHLEAYKLAIASWEDFLEACALLAKGEDDFESVAIDTVDNLFGFCTDYICRREKVSHVAVLPDKRGYSMVNGEFRRALVKLASLGLGLYMVSHAKQIEVKNRLGDKENKWTGSLSDTAQRIVFGMSDFIFFCDVEDEIDPETGRVTGQIHVIHTTPTTMYNAKARGMKGHRLPAKLPLDYSIFLQEYHKAYTEIAPAE